MTNPEKDSSALSAVFLEHLLLPPPRTRRVFTPVTFYLFVYDYAKWKNPLNTWLEARVGNPGQDDDSRGCEKMQPTHPALHRPERISPNKIISVSETNYQPWR